jgi:predicted transporter
MEYQSLILGVLLTIGIFAIKSGAGLAYIFTGRKGVRKNILYLLLFTITYGIIFLAAMSILKRVDPLSHLMRIQQLISSGMFIHIVMAILMIVWGILLIKHKRVSHKKSRGWMLLVIPCPVCITVIFITTGFLMALYPDRSYIVVSGLFAAFIIISLLTVVLISLYSRYRDIQPESFLGAIMLLIALYFIISVTVMPHFSDIDKVYRLAMYKGKRAPHEITNIVYCLTVLSLSFVSGFTYKFKKVIRSIK